MTTCPLHTARNPYSWKQARPTAVLLPPDSRSRKAQRRPTNNTEAVLWIREALRYREKEEYRWPHLVGREVRHGETDLILSVLGEREPGMSGRGGPPAAAATAKSLQSCPTLCDPIEGSPPGSPVPGILQARTLE